MWNASSVARFSFGSDMCVHWGLRPVGHGEWKCTHILSFLGARLGGDIPDRPCESVIFCLMCVGMAMAMPVYFALVVLEGMHGIVAYYPLRGHVMGCVACLHDLHRPCPLA